MSKIRVLVVDDHAMIRDGISAMLEMAGDMEVVGEAGTGSDALKLVKELSPDVVLMDIAMPVMGGLDAAERICKEYPQTKVLMLTQYDDEVNLLASDKAGALGFTPKTAISSLLLDGIRLVSQGKRFVHAGDR